MLQGSTLSYSLHRTKAVGPSSPEDKSQGSPAHMRSHPTATGPLPGQQSPSCRAPVTSSARGTGTMPRSGNAFTATAHQNEAQILQVPCEVTHNMNTKLLQDPLSVCTALSCRPPPPPEPATNISVSSGTTGHLSLASQIPHAYAPP